MPCHVCRETTPPSQEYPHPPRHRALGHGAESNRNLRGSTFKFVPPGGVGDQQQRQQQQ